jgi:putative methylase
MEHAGAAIRFLHADIRDPATPGLTGACDTVVMNPPFGAQQIHADRPFIDTALAIAPFVYSIFNAGSRSFVGAYLAGRGEIEEVIGGQLSIKRTFSFHRDEVREIPVEIMVIRRRGDSGP